VAVADFFDALTMNRCYRPAFSDARALEMLQAERGRAFDPAVVDCFLHHADTLISLRDRLNTLQQVAEASSTDPHAISELAE
jgi:putative two-component system response regulator